jgi:hypothetical protein
MARRKTGAADPSADAILREVMSSPEFVEALKARAIAGKVTATEANLLRSIGVAVPGSIRNEEDIEKEAMRRMTMQERSTLGDLLRKHNALIAEVRREIASPSLVTATDDDLLPPR